MCLPELRNRWAVLNSFGALRRIMISTSLLSAVNEVRQSFDREVGQPVLTKRKNLKLRHAQQIGRSPPRELALLQHLTQDISQP